jgi:hypothetical protein
MATKTINLKPEYAAKAIHKFIADSHGTNHRYLSWEHCFLAFQKAKEAKTKGQSPDYDHLSLHLACYLSSWGMLRNSFLLKRDYRTHLGIVELLLSDTYEQLWVFPARQNENQNTINLKDQWKRIAKMREDFATKYNVKNDSADNTDESETSITATLTTKILLGTCACVPATDRFYKLGVAAFGGTQRLGYNSYSEVVRYYWSNWDEISSHLAETSLVTLDDPSTVYPPMKLMDMCFWQIGKSIEIYNKNRGGSSIFSKLTEENKYAVLHSLLESPVD